MAVKRFNARVGTKLQLDCSYAEKPVWMDGSELQKLKVEQTKQLVRKGIGLNSKRRAGKPQSQELHIFSDDSVPNSPMAVADNLPESFSLLGNEIAIENFLVDPEQTFSNDNDRGIFFQLGEVYDTENDLASPNPSYDQDKPHSSVSAHQQSSQAPGFHDLHDFANLDNQNFNDWFKSQDFDPNSKNSVLNLPNNDHQIPFAQRLSSPEEADLLLYYMEIVCEKQLLVVSKVNRGWLYMAITQADLVYWATLSLASHYRDSKSVALTYFYSNLALLELRKTLLLIEFQQEKSLSRILDYCFSMIQLMFLEVIMDPDFDGGFAT
ncbi:hypothetical protein BGZ60DRAFT_533803 [Tricladium varicosporioides]|nr:hypothetical protein BGZ60DRAFT_533803 [Hymenoscyphus varicosporioides]